jgi:hypothetical protein
MSEDYTALVERLEAMGPKASHGGEQRHNRLLYVEAAAAITALCEQLHNENLGRLAVIGERESLRTLVTTLQADKARLREALGQAAEWFAEYSASHTAKGTPEASVKAITNDNRKAFCLAALKGTAP